MSRLYNNVPLQSIPVTTVEWQQQPWDPEIFKTGNGVLLEGKINNRSRHVINDHKQKARYCVFQVNMTRAHKRQYSASGAEVEPNFSETAKVRTGHLHSSYKTTAKGESDVLSLPQVRALVDRPELVAVTAKYNSPDTLALWMAEAQMQAIELNNGDEVRLRTCGNSPFIESITKLEMQSGTVGNYAGGEPVGASWTDKVMSYKGDQGPSTLPQDSMQGCDDDEWDD